MVDEMKESNEVFPNCCESRDYAFRYHLVFSSPEPIEYHVTGQFESRANFSMLFALATTRESGF
jgi:hypothetical protein